MGRLRGADVVAWSRRALEVAGPGGPVRIEAEALLGLGLDRLQTAGKENPAAA